MWEDILKKPIRNPRVDIKPKNDNLSMKEYEKLFEDIVDPEIERDAKSPNMSMAVVRLDKLDMSSEKAEEVAKKLYADMGYLRIFSDSTHLFFKLR